MVLLRKVLDLSKYSKNCDESLVLSVRGYCNTVNATEANEVKPVKVSHESQKRDSVAEGVKSVDESGSELQNAGTEARPSAGGLESTSANVLNKRSSVWSRSSMKPFAISSLAQLHHGRSFGGSRFLRGMSKARVPSGIGSNAYVQCRASYASEATKQPNETAVDAIAAKVEDLLKIKLQQVTELRTTLGQTKIGDITVGQVLGGMRDMIGMNCETSQLDANTGITYRGLTIPQMLEKLPGATAGCKCPYTESVLWLLLTGQIPSASEAQMLSKELAKRAHLPGHVYKVIDELPAETHPMTQYIVAIAALQTESTFRKAYNDKTYRKDTAWKLVLEDALDLIAKNSLIVGYIYRRAFIDNTVKNGKGMAYDADEDYAANVARLVGIDTPEFKEMMRLYIALHADHEGGNVSAHSAALIGSALADPYFCFAGALAGLSGPLHGLANQECLSWIKNMIEQLKGKEINVDTITQFAQETLKKGQVIPGYGHAVLRVPDPRHTAFVEFAHRNFPDDPLIKVLDICLEAIPPVLTATGKVKSPHPNVDCSTGIVLSHFGVTQPDIYTVFFGLSRAVGIMAQLVWARALRMPIERPKSHTLDSLHEMCKQDPVS
ncbi:citrate synthase [Babesia caballi]|uniref:Citrate synthase n=1 Tax=Babesia caballi TaxID=5871 RepID=A0AAV4LUL2_BABCB|nr:citrate synthase [Babesia caballi]